MTARRGAARGMGRGTGPGGRGPLGERLIAGAALALGLLLMSSYAGRSLAADILGLVLTLAGGGWLIAALRRARLTAPLAKPDPAAGALAQSRDALPSLAGPAGSGIAAVREGAIGYFGPLDGGVLARDALTRVDVVSLPGHPPRAAWRLADAEGTTVDIPADAEGASALLEALVTLPGFDSAAARDALADPAARPLKVWKGRAAGDETRLGSGRPSG
ncbi:MAG: hypothetical protein AAF577_07380 [Pseudomonadota bacterium]